MENRWHAAVAIQALIILSLDRSLYELWEWPACMIQRYVAIALLSTVHLLADPA
jgi:hypothetical protein